MSTIQTFVRLGVMVGVILVSTTDAPARPLSHPVRQARPAAATPAAAKPAATTTPAADTPACLDCHGPAKEFMTRSTVHTLPGPEKVTVNPHRYVPHKSTLESEIPECANCHTPHSLSTLPAAGSIDRSTLSVEWCFKTCHHTRDFSPCKPCHD